MAVKCDCIALVSGFSTTSPETMDRRGRGEGCTCREEDKRGLERRENPKRVKIR